MMKLTCRLSAFILLLLVLLPQNLMADEAVWIDVRTAEEYADGHVPQALSIPYEEIAKGVEELGLGLDQTIYLYCRSGRRSGIALETLQGLGFSNVRNLGGLEEAQQFYNLADGAESDT